MENVAVERRVWINAPRQRVWQAITEPAHLERWYAPGCPWAIPMLEASTTIKFYNTETDIQLATIEVVEPPHQLTLRWQVDPTNPELTLVNTFLLEEENGGTQVIASQAGYESLPDDMREQQLEQDAEAYTAIVESLKAYLER
ncbi:MAG TPA: SRPBCC domain-containing protein [Candidatus Saccharimonadales bacterium]|nr:SRPBCC domain-containing protein [Candidatus Saccharimonadales bacterium]